MASARGVKPTKVKVQEHRDRLRAQGLRPIQIWVPDVRALVLPVGGASPIVGRGDERSCA